MIGPATANRIWLLSQRKAWRSYARNAAEMAEVQQKKLLDYIRQNRLTDFGEAHGFSQIGSYRHFQKHVPVMEDWEQFLPWIAKIASGEKNTLTAEPVTAFEETSGSSGFSKLIPYTKSLRAEFEAGVSAWMCALSKSHPAVFRGRFYWALSPAMKAQQHTSGGVPIGLEDDSEYFSPLAAWLLGKILAVPSHIKNIRDAERFYKESLLHLLAAEDLSFVSVWSPTFFLQLDRKLQSWGQELLRSGEGRTILSQRRRNCLQERLSNSFQWQDLWPELSCLSCWTDAQSAFWLPEVTQRLGNARIQGKGLLSTECIVSIPISSSHDPLLSYPSHFYEFRHTASGDIFLPHQLEKGEAYEAIVTTAGGLYRYATADVVEISGHWSGIPAMRFVGRRNRTSDMVGEKLSEAQLTKALLGVLEPHRQMVDVAFVSAERSGADAGYVLCISGKSDTALLPLTDIVAALELALHQNPYYRQAVDLGQLQPLQARLLPALFRDRLIGKLALKSGSREGNIKVPVLFRPGQLNELLADSGLNVTSSEVAQA